MTYPDDYDARVTAYVQKHGWEALLRAWVHKTRAEASPNPRVLVEREMNLRTVVADAWTAMGDG